MITIRQKTRLYLIVYTALWCAIIFLAVYLVKIPLANGYAHIGDGLMYISTIFLPFPLAASAGALASALADIASGYGIYAPFTLVIKAVSLIWFYLFKKADNTFLRHIVPVILAALTSAILYVLCDYVLYGAGALLSVWGNVMQGAVGIAVYSVSAHILEYKFKIKK